LARHSSRCWAPSPSPGEHDKRGERDHGDGGQHREEEGREREPE
jgi:hypothetical protein